MREKRKAHETHIIVNVSLLFVLKHFKSTVTFQGNEGDEGKGKGADEGE